MYRYVRVVDRISPSVECKKKCLKSASEFSEIKKSQAQEQSSTNKKQKT